MAASNPSSSSSARSNFTPIWSDAEILALIDCYREKWHSLHCQNLTAADWDEVAARVNLRCPYSSLSGASKTSNQCRDKLGKLRQHYRKESLLLLPFSNWRFFTPMARLENPDPNPHDDNGVTVGAAGPDFLNKGGSANAGAKKRGTKRKREEENAGGLERRRREEDEENGGRGVNWMGELAKVLRQWGDIYARLERMRMDMEKDMQKMRMEMEVKRMEMIRKAQKKMLRTWRRAYNSQAR